MLKSRPVLPSTHVKLAGVGTALPSLCVSQQEVLEFILSHFKIETSTQKLYTKLLTNRSIQSRYFFLDNLAQVLETDRSKIAARFELAARELSTVALMKALKQSDVLSETLDYIVTTTCTGYICPGLSSHLIETCSLKSNIEQIDLTGMGCGAALPAIQQAQHFLKRNPGKTAAVVSVEICSAAMFSNDDPDIAVSNSIFSDGAAAVILKSHQSNDDQVESNASSVLLPDLVDYRSEMMPAWRESLRFINEDGYLKNRLGKNVSEQSAQLADQLIRELLEKWHLHRSDIKHWMFHPGGEKVLNAVSQRLQLASRDVESAREVLRLCGNMSSPSVLFVLEKEQQLNPPTPGEWGIMSAFGAGFSGYAMLVRY